MKTCRLFLPLLLLLAGIRTQASDLPDSLQTQLRALNHEIARRQQYDLERKTELLGLKSAFRKSSTPQDEFRICARLQGLYFTFDFDSALHYAQLLQHLAQKLAAPHLQAQARLALSNTLLSGGFFEQADSTLRQGTTTASLPDSLQAEFLYAEARLQFDRAEYYQKTFWNRLEQRGLLLLDSAMRLAQSRPQRYLFLRGLYLVRTAHMPQATACFDSLFLLHPLSERDYAVAASTHAFAHKQQGHHALAMYWLARAATADIRLCNKENVALTNLAELLYRQGQIAEASLYINTALNDALQYGALQRKNQLVQILPMIQAEMLRLSQEKSKQTQRYLALLGTLVVLLVASLALLYRQNSGLQQARATLAASNASLSSINSKLRELHLINERYIGQFFKNSSELIDLLERYQQSVENKLMANKTHEISGLLSLQQVHNERKKLFQHFDTLFLNIFPDFVPSYNALFPPEHHVQLSPTGGLNTDTRIFALIRLGIGDSEKIAHILNYSVHTINTYKSKVKNRSILPNDEFEAAIQQIKSV